MPSFHLTRLCAVALLGIWALNAGALSPPRANFGLLIEIQNATGHEMRICWQDILAEIQVNTPDMIYAKEKPAVARAISG